MYTLYIRGYITLMSTLSSCFTLFAIT